MKIFTVFLLSLLGCLTIAAQEKRADSIVAGTEAPVLLDKSGAGVNFAMTEDEYGKLMNRLAAAGRDYIRIKNKPEKLTAEARFGLNMVVNGKNVGWILDGSDERGYVFYLDWNADGNLNNDGSVKLKKIDGKYTHLFSKTLIETIDNRKRKYRFDLKIEVAKVEPPGESVGKLAIKYYDSTSRRGTLNVADRQVAFGLDGSAGIYNSPYNNLYFDLNGDGKLDVQTRYSPEKYKITEKYVNIGDATYEFSVDRYGDRLTLKPLAEKLPARVNLTPGNSAPEISFTDLDGQERRLSDFRGKVVLLDFWGLWCAPCVAEAPNLAAAYRKLKEKGFEIVSFDKGDTIENLKKFIDKTRMNWAHSQADETILQLYRIDRYPTYFLLDKEGKIVSNTLRPGEELYKKIEEMLEK
jgi:thiol-disulfide isomerase/thioredoxin